MIKRIYTIGFTKKNAERFFTILSNERVTTVIDVRLNNVSQLAGFAKRDDLAFFLRHLCKSEYLHLPSLAPTKKILDGYKKGELDWKQYEQLFKDLLVERRVEQFIEGFGGDHICLLCSEASADKCHRRLVAEYFVQKSPLIETIHLKD